MIKSRTYKKIHSSVQSIVLLSLGESIVLLCFSKHFYLCQLFKVIYGNDWQARIHVANPHSWMRAWYVVVCHAFNKIICFCKYRKISLMQGRWMKCNVSFSLHDQVIPHFGMVMANSMKVSIGFHILLFCCFKYLRAS